MIRARCSDSSGVQCQTAARRQRGGWFASPTEERTDYAWRLLALRILVQLAAYQRLSTVTKLDLLLEELRGCVSVEERQRNCAHPRSERTGKGSNVYSKITSCTKCGQLFFCNGEPVFANPTEAGRNKVPPPSSAPQPRAWQSTSEREARAPEPERGSSSAGLADAEMASQLVGQVHALAAQAQGFQNREEEEMAEQREAMRVFEARQEMQLQMQV